MTSRPKLPRQVTRLLMLATAILLTAFITQCRMVTDKIVRPQAEDFRTNSCVKACAKAANEAKEAENELHEDRIQACGGDEDDGSDDLRGAGTFGRDKPGDKPDGGGRGDNNDKRKACIAAEEARHKAALKAIDDQRKACVNGCHHQGGGTGR